MSFLKTLILRLRLSPLMVIVLAAAASMVVISSLYAVYAILGPESAPPSEPPEWRPPAFVADEAASQTAADDLETLNRPIFNKSRRPIAATSSVAARQDSAEPVASLTGLQLAGIIKKGKSRQAFILSPTNPGGEWLAAGETVNSWTISIIGDTELTLRSGAKSTRLQLYPPSDEKGPDQQAAPNPHLRPRPGRFRHHPHRESRGRRPRRKFPLINKGRKSNTHSLRLLPIGCQSMML